MTPRKQCFPCIGLMCKWIHRGHASTHKIYTGSSQAISQFLAVDTKFHPSQESMCNWSLLGKGKSVFFSEILLDISTILQSRSMPRSSWPWWKELCFLFVCFGGLFICQFLSFSCFKFSIVYLLLCFNKIKDKTKTVMLDKANQQA